jgi:hypothetical protein
MFRRKKLDERLKVATAKLLERDLRTGIDFADREVRAVSWQSEGGGEMRVELLIGPRASMHLATGNLAAMIVAGSAEDHCA